MVTVTLTPELEVVVAAKAKEAGTTPEQFALATLEKQLIKESSQTEKHPANGAEPPKTLADLLGDSIGSIQSRDGNLSKDTGRKFAEGMAKKRREGKF